MRNDSRVGFSEALDDQPARLGEAHTRGRGFRMLLLSIIGVLTVLTQEVLVQEGLADGGLAGTDGLRA